jgi:hypothetical protein
MARKLFIGRPDESARGVNYRSALNHPGGRTIGGVQEKVDFVEHQAGADETVRLVDDAGRPLGPEQALELKRSIDFKNQQARKREQRKARKAEEKGIRKAAAREQVKLQRKAEREHSRRSTIGVGLVFWVVCLIAGISGHLSVGFFAVWLLLAPVWIVVGGLIGRMFLAALRW